MPCLKLEPFPVCGFNGDCITSLSENETISFCRCNKGWSQSREFAYFNPNDELRAGTCFYHRDIIDHTLYSLVVIASLLSLVAGVLVIKTRKQLQRQIPNLLSHMINLILSVYRLTNPAEALFGIDFLFSFLISITIALNNISVIIFFNKYIQYLMQKIEFVDKTGIRKRGEFLRKLSYAQVVLEIVLAQLLWIVPLTSRGVGLTILKIYFSYQTLAATYRVALNKVSLGYVIKDMEKVIQVNSSAITLNYDSRNRKMKNWVERTLPRTRQTQIMVYLHNSSSAMIYLMTVAWGFFLQLWVYLLPLTFLVQAIMNAFVIRARVFRKNRNQNSSQVSRYSTTTDLNTSKNTSKVSSYGNSPGSQI